MNKDFINRNAGRSSEQWARECLRKYRCLQEPTGEKYGCANTNHHATIERFVCWV